MKLELVKGPLAEAWGTLRSDFWTIFVMMLKLEVLGFLVVAASLALAAAGWIALAGTSVLAAIALAVLLALAGLLASSVVLSVAYNFIDARSAKKRLDFSAALQGNILPIIGYDLVGAAIYLVAFAPFIAALFLLYGSTGFSGRTASLLAEFLLRFGLTALSAVITLFIQFAVFELLISRAGVLGSFGKSLRTVRRNLLETIAFSIILWAVESAIAIPFTIAIMLIIVLGVIGGIAAGPIVFAIAAIIFIALLLPLGALTMTVSITAKHKYWMRARRAN